MTIKQLILWIVLALMAGAVAIDYLAGREFNLWRLYLLPIALSTFSLGVRVGYFLCLAATGLLFLSGYLLGNPSSSTAVYFVDRLSSALAYLVITFLIGIGLPDR